MGISLKSDLPFVLFFFFFNSIPEVRPNLDANLGLERTGGSLVLPKDRNPYACRTLASGVLTFSNSTAHTRNTGRRYTTREFQNSVDRVNVITGRRRGHGDDRNPQVYPDRSRVTYGVVPVLFGLGLSKSEPFTDRFSDASEHQYNTI